MERVFLLAGNANDHSTFRCGAQLEMLEASQAILETGRALRTALSPGEVSEESRSGRVGRDGQVVKSIAVALKAILGQNPVNLRHKSFPKNSRKCYQNLSSTLKFSKRFRIAGRGTFHQGK
jgi:hypothetical protein